ncbi:MAG: hypothetical protein OHK0056_17840 [Bacteriovoracaceae bacterium]
MTSAIAKFHFAPTEVSKQNLISQKYLENIFVTGNTSIDALDITLQKYKDQNISFETKHSKVDFSKKVFLVTCHRRENFGEPLIRIFNTIKEIVSNLSDVEVIFPVHLNPNVQSEAKKIFSSIHRVHLCEPVDYFEFVWLMKKSYLILSDSGGVQEEAPHLGIPVIVLRENTERPEGVTAGVSFLAGSDPEKIKNYVKKFMDPVEYKKFKGQVNPYGDGHASEKIFNVLREKL